MRRWHDETHRTERIAWLRAAVLGANDGIVSIAGLLVGVAAAGASGRELLQVGVAGIVAGATSMAAGEYVSVRSQADTEAEDLERERTELATAPEAELEELTMIYVGRGLDRALAAQVAAQLTAHDALSAHARDELGITEATRARPLLASVASAAAFAAGAALPLGAALLAPAGAAELVIAVCTLVALVGTGALAAWAGGTQVIRGGVRVAFWGVVAMGLAALVGRVFGVVV